MLAGGRRRYYCVVMCPRHCSYRLPAAAASVRAARRPVHIRPLRHPPACVMAPAMARSIGAYSGLRRAGAPASGSGLRSSASRAVACRRSAPVVAIAEPPSRPLEVQSQRPKPRVPENTPLVDPLELPLRPRRNRRSPTVRAAFREARAHPTTRSDARGTTTRGRNAFAVRISQTARQWLTRALPPRGADVSVSFQLPSASLRARRRRGHPHRRHARLQPPRLVRVCGSGAALAPQTLCPDAPISPAFGPLGRRVCCARSRPRAPWASTASSSSPRRPTT